MALVNTGTDSIGARRIPSSVDDTLGPLSAVSWTAIFAGAAGAAALSLLLLILGTGLGLSAVSPWSMEGISATTFGFGTIAWLTFTQLAAAGMGGYLAGRLRTKWTAVDPDEVYFRDTAHGFLAWAVATLLTAAVLTSVMGSIVSGGVRAGATVAGGAASAVGTAAGGAASAVGAVATGSDQVTGSIEYFIDSLFRQTSDSAEGAASETLSSNESASEQSVEQETARQAAPAAAQQVRGLAQDISEIPTAQIMRIFTRAISTGTLPEDDKRYVAQQIAQRTDMTQQEAEQNVSDGFEEVQTTLNEAENTAREAVDEAREATAYGTMWVFISLLIGAFVASLMAVFGGRQRDS
jgi:hypothetical protein